MKTPATVFLLLFAFISGAQNIIVVHKGINRLVIRQDMNITFTSFGEKRAGQDSNNVFGYNSHLPGTDAWIVKKISSTGLELEYNEGRKGDFQVVQVSDTVWKKRAGELLAKGYVLLQEKRNVCVIRRPLRGRVISLPFDSIYSFTDQDWMHGEVEYWTRGAVCCLVGGGALAVGLSAAAGGGDGAAAFIIPGTLLLARGVYLIRRARGMEFEMPGHFKVKYDPHYHLQ